jgi:hypothetical protein
MTIVFHFASIGSLRVSQYEAEHLRGGDALTGVKTGPCPGNDGGVLRNATSTRYEFVDYREHGVNIRILSREYAC